MKAFYIYVIREFHQVVNVVNERLQGGSIGSETRQLVDERSQTNDGAVDVLQATNRQLAH